LPAGWPVILARLGVTLDYLVKDAEYQNIDQDALTRLKLIEKLPQEERSHLFATMDAFFAKNKLQALLKKQSPAHGQALSFYLTFRYLGQARLAEREGIRESPTKAISH